MKISRKTKYATGLSLLGLATLALVSWSPTAPTTAGSDITMNGGRISISAGPIEAKNVAGSVNGLASSAAVVVGANNNTDGAGTSALSAK